MRHAWILAAGLAAPAAALAQLPDPSPRALAMGGAYTSLARGYEAVTWNPAMLATAGNRSFTIGLPHITFEVGSNTYGTGDFRKYADATLSDADKQYLLDQISADDSLLQLRYLAGIQPVGLSIGRFALAVGTAGDAAMSVGPDAVELMLFGNARRSGPGEFYDLRGSSARGWLATTIAGSFAMPLRLNIGRVGVGATYKYIIGHFIGRAAETSSRFQVNPDFNTHFAAHSLYTDYEGLSLTNPDLNLSSPGDFLSGEGKAGSGYGVDIGVTWQPAGRSFTLSAVVVNALGSMEWDEGRFAYERSVDSLRQDATGAVLNSRTTTRLTTSAAIETDPAARALRDELLAESDFARVLRVGVALRKGLLTLSGGGQLRLSSGLDRQLQRALSGGAELSFLKVLKLRGGAATDFGHTLMLSGGAGLNILGLNIDLSAAHIGGSERPGVVVGFGLGLMW